MLPVQPLLPTGARVLTVGSCFAAVLGRKLADLRLPVLENPFGTVLNPVSAMRLLAVACGMEDYDLIDRIVEREGRWVSYDAPPAISGDSPEELVHAVADKLAEVRAFVQRADLLVLTMGTAWAWRLDGEVVANCHKQPAGLFQKSLLSVQEIVKAFAEAHSYLLRVNPKLRVALTVSPVRHRTETLPGSSVSKSTLRLAAHHLSEAVRGVTYFPAYELLLDDLRDYRFYADDLLHPSALAEDYIFQKFTGAWFENGLHDVRAAWTAVRQALGHRSANPTGEQHQAHLLKVLDQLDVLANQGFAVADEVATVTAQLIAPRPPAASQPRPGKPVIRVQLDDRTTSAPRPQPLASPMPPPAAPPEPVADDRPEQDADRPTTAAADPDARTGRRRSRGGRNRGRDRDRDRSSERDERRPADSAETPVPLPDEPAEVLLEGAHLAADEAAALPGNPETAEQNRTRKRRGRRGGRRNKHSEGEANDTGSESATAPVSAEMAFADEPEATNADFADEVNGPAADEVAMAPELIIQPPAPVVAPAAPSASNALARTPSRSSGRGAGRNGAKKVQLVKVTKPEPVPAEPAVPPTPVPPPASEAETTGTRPVAASAPAKPGRDRKKRPAAPRVAPAPAAAPPVISPPQITSAEAPPAASEAVATEPLRRAPIPLNNQPTKPRTPGNSKVNGPRATPAEQAQAARQVKKAGVGALLAALGGAAATPSAEKAPLTETPVPPAAPEIRPEAPTSELPPPAAPAKPARRKAPAKAAPKSASKAPAATTPEPPTPPAAAAPAARRRAPARKKSQPDTPEGA